MFLHNSMGYQEDKTRIIQIKACSGSQVSTAEMTGPSPTPTMRDIQARLREWQQQCQTTNHTCRTRPLYLLLGAPSITRIQRCQGISINTSLSRPVLTLRGQRKLPTTRSSLREHNPSCRHPHIAPSRRSHHSRNLQCSLTPA